MVCLSCPQDTNGYVISPKNLTTFWKYLETYRGNLRLNFKILLLKLGKTINIINYFKDQRLLSIRHTTVMFRGTPMGLRVTFFFIFLKKHWPQHFQLLALSQRVSRVVDK